MTQWNITKMRQKTNSTRVTAASSTQINSIGTTNHKRKEDKAKMLIVTADENRWLQLPLPAKSAVAERLIWNNSKQCVAPILLLCRDSWRPSNNTYCSSLCWSKGYICWETVDCNEFSQVLSVQGSEVWSVQCIWEDDSKVGMVLFKDNTSSQRAKDSLARKLEWWASFAPRWRHGVHCTIHKLIHPTLSKNPKNYSHKHHQAALTYELGVLVYKNKLVQIKGPLPALKHGITIYQQELKNKIPADKRAIGATMDIMVNLILSVHQAIGAQKNFITSRVGLEHTTSHSTVESRTSSVFPSNSIMGSICTKPALKPYVSFLISNGEWLSTIWCLK